MTSLRAGAAGALLLLGAALAPAQAQDAQQVKAAREVVEISGGAAGLKDIVSIFLDEAKRTFTRTRPELANDLDEALAALKPEFEKRRDALIDDIAKVYAQRFTAQELADIKAFYATPSGRKLVAQLPGILQASYERTNAWSQAMSQEVITKLRAEMRKRGKDI